MLFVQEEEKEWFAKEFEGIQTEMSLLDSEKKEIAYELIKSQVNGKYFHNFTQNIV